MATQHFVWVCLAPSLVINPVLMGIGLAFPVGIWQILIVSALLLHISAASGDIALVNLLWRERKSGGLFTYDDLSVGETYFFRVVSDFHTHLKLDSGETPNENPSGNCD